MCLIYCTLVCFQWETVASVVMRRDGNTLNVSKLLTSDFDSGLEMCRDCPSFPPDDRRRDQVCCAGGVGPEPRPSARVPAAAGGDRDGSRPGGRRRRGLHRQHHPRGPHPAPGQRALPHRSGTAAAPPARSPCSFTSAHSAPTSPAAPRNPSAPAITSWRRTQPPGSATSSMIAPLVVATEPWPTCRRQLSPTCRTSYQVPAVWCSENAHLCTNKLERLRQLWKASKAFFLLNHKVKPIEVHSNIYSRLPLHIQSD